MAAQSNSPHNTSISSTHFMELPEHVFGFVDLNTLTDIHRYLVESEMEEDIALAKWVQENYLFEPTDKVGGTIRTTEGFSQLDRAYRRVRSLTNKAQDKWPFFDRNWKEMSSITVRNNARGEVAPGVTYSSLPGAKHDAAVLPAVNGFDKVKSPFASNAHVPSETTQTAQSQNSPRPVQKKSVQLPSVSAEVENQSWPEIQSIASPLLRKSLSEQERGSIMLIDTQSTKALPSQTAQEHYFQSQPETIGCSKLANKTIHGETEAVSESSHAKSTQVNQDSVDAGILSDSTRSPASKVRGPNGRYLSRIDHSPVPKKTRRRSSGLQTQKKLKSFVNKVEATTEDMSKVKRRRVGNRMSVDTHPVIDPSVPVVDERVHSDAQSSHLSINQYELENGTSSENNFKSGPDGIMNMNALVADGSDESAATEWKNDTHHDETASNGSSTSQILAAEAEAVASNLDRLPPGHTQRSTKRKRTSATEQGERKRGRHGGIVGRPRKTDERAKNSDTETSKNIEAKMESSIPVDSRPVDDQGPERMTTRRQTRRSAAPMLGDPSSDLSEAIPGSTGKQVDSVINGHVQVEDAAMNANSFESENTGFEDRDSGNGNITGKKAANSRFSKSPVTSTRKSRSKMASFDAGSQFQIPEPRLLSIALSKTGTPKRLKLKQGTVQESGKIKKSGTSAANSKPKTRSLKSATKALDTNDATDAQAPGKSDASEAPQGHTAEVVEYLARIHTASGAVDIPISSENVDATEHESIRKYAEWMATEGGTYIPYQQFRSIFGFAKKG